MERDLVMTTAYQLGQEAYKAGHECIPFEDEHFVEFIEKFDPPVTLTIKEYVEGFYEERDTNEPFRNVIDAHDRFGA